MRLYVLFVFCFLSCCDSGFQQIDRRVEQMMGEQSRSFGSKGPDVILSTEQNWSESIENTNPNTVNPSIDELNFIRAEDINASAVAQSLDSAENTLASISKTISLEEALLWANKHSKEMEFAKYDYLSSTLSLLGELHLWGPRFSNTIKGTVNATSSDGFYDTSLDVVNDFNITKKLHGGGTITASALSSFANDLHSTTSSASDSNTSIGVSIDIPLLRGSGAVARESLIQSKRNLVYAARSFERFRRVFYRNVVRDYLSLVVQKQSLNNAQMGVDSLKELAKRQAALYKSGRARLYDSADAENQALAAVARLSQSWEQYLLALDRFKIRIGLPIDDVVDVEPTLLGVFPPSVDVTTAVIQALKFRLDLQNELNRLQDSKRWVANAENDLLPDAVFTAGASVDSRENTFAKFSGEDVDYLAEISVGLPLDRETQRIAVRQQQIAVERSKRTYRESRDTIAVEVRSALRNIEVFQFTLELQERNVEIAQLGLNSINADPDRVSVLDQTRAISDLQRAKDARDSARRDLDLSIVNYLLQAGQLRISPYGELVLPSE